MPKWWNGRHVRFRCVWRNLCGFKSRLRHHKTDDDISYRLFYLDGEGLNSPVQSTKGFSASEQRNEQRSCER